MIRNLLVSIAVVLVSTLQSLAATPPSIYWSDWNDRAIKRMNPEGTFVETVLLLNGQPSGLAIDLDTNQLFWGMWTGPDRGKILSANLDGSNQSVVADTGAFQIWNIAISADTIYFNSFGETGSTGLGRANRDGSDVEFYEGSGYGEALAFDPSTELVYYQTQAPTNPIFRREADGVMIPEMILEQTAGYQDFVAGMTIDRANQHLYFTDSNAAGHRILRSKLDGSNLTLVADVEGFGRLYSLMADPEEQVVYYGTFGGTIGRVDYDGSDPQILTSQRGLYSFAFEFRREVAVPEPSAFFLCIAGLGGHLCLAGVKKKLPPASSTCVHESKYR